MGCALLRVARRLGWVSMLVLAAASWGCAPEFMPLDSGRERLVERSAQSRPGWITQLPQEQGYFFAAGIATGASSLEEGRTAGIQAAVQDVVNYLGIRTQVHYSETRTELTTRLVNRVTSEGFAQVTKSRPVEMYYERFSVSDTGKAGERFDVYVLLRIPQGMLKEEERRLASDRQRRLALADKLLQEGRTYAEGGDVGAALRRWLEAGRLVEGEWEADALRQEIRTAQSDLAGAVVLIADGKAGSAADKDASRTVLAVLRQGAKESPLRRLPLQIRFQTAAGIRVETAATDEAGVARVALPPDRGAPARVGVGIDLDRLLLLGGGRNPPREDLPAALRGLAAITLWLNRPEGNSQEIANSPSLPWAQTDRPAESSADWSGRFPQGEAPSAGGPLSILIAPSSTRVSSAGSRQPLEIGYLVDIRTPTATFSRRPPFNLALVIDRSGSMSDAGKMEYVKEAVRLVARNLEPQDKLSIVVYSDTADTLLAGGTGRDRLLIDHHLDMLEPMGSTNLSSGLFEGMDLLRASLLDRGSNRLVLLSDGLANRGVTGVRKLVEYAARAGGENISISTVGVGRDFDENLLMSLASASGGNYYYVGDAERLPEVFREEMQGLASVVAQNVTLTLRFERGVEVADVFGRSFEEAGDAVRIRLGDMISGDRRLIGLALRLPPRSEGLKEIGRLEADYDQVADMIGRVNRRFPIRIAYTRDRNAVEAGLDPRVDRYLQVLAVLDVMSLAMQSNDPRMVRETLKYLESRMQLFNDWSRRIDDPEVADLIGVLDDCVVELRRMSHSGHGAVSTPRGLGREIRFKLYRLGQQAGR